MGESTEQTPSPSRNTVPPASSPAPFPGRALARLCMLSAVAIWGSTFVVVKIALDDMGPLQLAALRFALAAAVLLPLTMARGTWRRVPLLPMAATGFFGVTLFMSLQNVGLFYTSAANVGLILGGIPVFTLILSALVLKEPMAPLRIMGVAASVLGVALIVWSDAAAATGDRPLLGSLLAVGSALAWALYTVKGKALLERLPQETVAAGSVSFGCLFLLPLALAEAQIAGWGSWSPAVWFAVVYLGLLASAGAFFLWNFGLKSVAASEAGTFTNLSPVVAILAAAAVLGEPVTLFHLGGGSLVIVGVYLARGAAAAKCASP